MVATIKKKRIIMTKTVIVGFGRIAVTHLFQLLGLGVEKKQIIVVEKSFIIVSVLRMLGIPAIRKLETIDVDVSHALICLPTHLHYPVAKILLEKNINCFVEKPLTEDFLKSTELVRIASEKNLLLEVGYVYRFMPTFQELKSRISAGKVKVTKGRFSVLSNSFVDGATDWRATYSGGGGIVSDLGPHAIHLALYLFGIPNEINLQECRQSNSSKVHDSVVIAFEYRILCIEIELNWADPQTRKTELIFRFSDDLGNDFSVSREAILSLNEDPKLRTRLAELNTAVDFYLRGEEFAIQAQYFLDGSKYYSQHRKDRLLYCEVDRIVSYVNQKLMEKFDEVYSGR